MIINFYTLTRWLNRYRVHLISWAIFLTWEVIIIGLFAGVFGHPLSYIIHYAINISLFYLHAYLLKWATISKREAYWKVPLVVILEAGSYLALVYFLDIFLMEHTNIMVGTKPSFSTLFFKIFYRASFFLLFSTGYFFLKEYISEKLERQRVESLRFQILLEKERAEKDAAVSKNAFLRAQINPHFLFNTLEFLHQKMKKYSAEDASMMVYLSDMLRFASAPADKDGLIDLSEEISQCQNLIRLYRYSGGDLLISIGYSEDIKGLRFIPLVLMTILENMIKHGNVSSQKGSIDIFLHEGALKIESKNLAALQKNRIGYGSGLDNIKTRLEYAYGKAASFNSQLDEEGFYVLEISVQLSAFNDHSGNSLKNELFALEG